MKLKNIIALIMSLLVIISAALYGFIGYYSEKDALVEGIDSKLLATVHLSKEILSSDYHNNIIDANSVSTDQYRNIVKRWDSLCVKLGLEYIWSLALIDGKLVFTSGSSTSKDVANGDYAKFYEAHSNPEAYDVVFSSMTPQFQVNDDKWGRIRAVLVPFKDSKGRKYLFGASMKMTAVDETISRTMWRSIGYAFAILVLGIILSALLARSVCAPIEVLMGIAHRIAAGQEVENEPVSGSCEMVSLADSINSMGLSIQEKINELHRKEQNLSTTLNSIGDAVIATDENGNITRMNPVAEKLTGWNIDDASGKPLLDVFHIISSITREVCENPVGKVLASGDVIGLANHTALIAKDGVEYQIADSGAPIRNMEGAIIGVVLVFRDVSNEYAMQEKVISSEQRFIRSLEAVNIGMWDLNLQSGEAIVNESWARIIGYSLHELVPVTMDTWNSLVHPEDLPRFEAEFEKHLSGVADHYECDVRLQHKSGHWVDVLDRGKVFEWAEDGSPLRVIGTEEDITKRKQVEDQLRQSEKMQAIGQLAGGVAHDFNNMLGGIIGASELLNKQLAKNDKAVKFTDMITNTAERAAELTDKLLAFSRKGKSVSTPVDIHGSINEATAILERSIDKRITLNSKLEASCHEVIGDPSQLQNTILNIGLNARDAMPDGGDLTITTENVELNEKYCQSSSANLSPGNYILISISDTGTGIPRDIVDNIFEPFFTTKEQGKGTGLGLAAVYGAVREHKGDVRVYSELEEGSVFHIFLPVQKHSISSQASTSEITPVVSRGQTILLIDDEDIIRTVGSHTLEDMGFEVILAENGEEGVAMYREHRYTIDLVILDMVMPRMNGREAFRAIRKLDSQAKVIMSSGFAKDAKMAELIEEGLAGFIKKPFRQSELSKILSETLG